MVTRIDDLGKYYAELSVKAEQNKAEKSEAIRKAMNEEAERQRAKRDAQQLELQTLMAKGLQKQWESKGDYESEETIQKEKAYKLILDNLNL